jgi:hypothetical protein
MSQVQMQSVPKDQIQLQWRIKIIDQKVLGSIERFEQPYLSSAAESPKCVDVFYGQHTRALERADYERTKKAKMPPREVRPPWQGG